jgi:hypothetical protein
MRVNGEWLEGPNVEVNMLLLSLAIGFAALAWLVGEAAES